jgi:hypothetical protein
MTRDFDVARRAEGAAPNFFVAAIETFRSPSKNSYIFKTVGVQALFDVLRALAQQAVEKKDISVAYFRSFLQKAEHVDFADNYFQASGIGRIAIRKIILFANSLLPGELEPDERERFDRLLKPAAT